jgi:hypothetical protein
MVKKRVLWDSRGILFFFLNGSMGKVRPFQIGWGVLHRIFWELFFGVNNHKRIPEDGVHLQGGLHLIPPSPQYYHSDQYEESLSARIPKNPVPHLRR